MYKGLIPALAHAKKVRTAYHIEHSQYPHTVAELSGSDLQELERLTRYAYDRWLYHRTKFDEKYPLKYHPTIWPERARPM